MCTASIKLKVSASTCPSVACSIVKLFIIFRFDPGLMKLRYIFNKKAFFSTSNIANCHLDKPVRAGVISRNQVCRAAKSGLQTTLHAGGYPYVLTYLRLFAHRAIISLIL